MIVRAAHRNHCICHKPIQFKDAIYTAGCPRNCVHHATNDLTSTQADTNKHLPAHNLAVAISGQNDVHYVGGFDVFVESKLTLLFNAGDRKCHQNLFVS